MWTPNPILVVLIGLLSITNYVQCGSRGTELKSPILVSSQTVVLQKGSSHISAGNLAIGEAEEGAQQETESVSINGHLNGITCNTFRRSNFTFGADCSSAYPPELQNLTSFPQFPFDAKNLTYLSLDNLIINIANLVDLLQDYPNLDRLALYGYLEGKTDKKVWLPKLSGIDIAPRATEGRNFSPIEQFSDWFVFFYKDSPISSIEEFPLLKTNIYFSYQAFELSIDSSISHLTLRNPNFAFLTLGQTRALLANLKSYFDVSSLFINSGIFEQILELPGSVEYLGLYEPTKATFQLLSAKAPQVKFLELTSINAPGALALHLEDLPQHLHSLTMEGKIELNVQGQTSGSGPVFEHLHTLVCKACTITPGLIEKFEVTFAHLTTVSLSCMGQGIGEILYKNFYQMSSVHTISVSFQNGTVVDSIENENVKLTLKELEIDSLTTNFVVEKVDNVWTLTYSDFYENSC